MSKSFVKARNMKFNIFLVFMIVVGFLNFSIDLIQRDRFRREREMAMASGGPTKRALRHKKDQKEERKSFMKKLLFMLEYNELSFAYCFCLFFSLFLMNIMLGLSAIYTFFPHTRDSKSGLYENPVLKFAESIYLFDWMHCYKRTRYYNCCVLVMAIQYLSIRLINIKRIYETSWINKTEYKKINVIQLNFSYLEEIQLDSRGWFQLMFYRGEHNCKMSGDLYNEKSRAMRQLFYQVNRLDRLYYYNVLDFDDCYRDLDLKVIHHPVKEDKQPTSYRQVSWRMWLLRFRLPNFRFHVTTPLHRIDRTDLASLAILNTIGVIFMIMALIYAVLTTSWAILKHNSVEMSSFTSMLDQISASPKIYMSIILSFTCFCVVAFSVADNGVLVMSSIFLVSRARKIKEMLNHESRICRQHLLEFNNQLVARKAQVTNNEQEQNIKLFIDGTRMENTPLARCAITPLLNLHHPIKLAKQSATYDQLAEQYKAQMIRVNQGRDIRSLNENLSYLIDLISHLRSEQEDIKRFFTARLNINIVVGTLGGTIALSEWMKANTLDEQLLFYLFVIIVLLPMFLALFVGATSEAAIYRSLEPLMANDLRLVKTDVIKKMQRVYVHLGRAENRGFILLGNLSLNFGSLVTIFATIGSVFILCEKRDRYV